MQEQQAWEILEAATTQLRVAPTGKVMGIDMTAALETAKARNFDMEIVTQLLKEGEAGILDAVSEDEAPEAVWLRSDMERARRQEWRRTRTELAKAGALYAQPSSISIRICRNVSALAD